MFCKNCGAEIRDNQTFCQSCGTKISNNSSNVNASYNTVQNASVKTNSVNIDQLLSSQSSNFNVFRGKVSKAQTIVTIIGFIVVIAAASTAIFLNNNSNKKKLKTGIETREDGSIVWNKGNNVYACDELMDDGTDTYYFGNDNTMVKNEWIQAKGKWYYCESNGKIAKGKWVEGQYYVNDYGEMLINTTTPDGNTVGADGKKIDQAAILAAQQAQAAAAAAQQRAQQSQSSQQTSNNNTNTSNRTNTTTNRSNNEVLDIDYSKPVWIQSYDSFSDYIEFDDETNVDVIIKYPIFGGQDQLEADAMNTCMDGLRSDMLEIADGDIQSEEKPKNYKITEANIANIEENKINVVLKGKLERSGKSAKDVRIRFIYDRQSGTAFVKE